MDQRGIARLKEEQHKAISETQERIAQLEKYRRDYECLGDRLHTLPHKTTHHVMVPFGKMGFMPGQLVHTNEIMVLLGDNWFAERSAKQAEEIVQRRIKGVDDQLEGLRQQQGLLEPRVEYTTEIQQQGKNEIVEIKEDFDPEKEIAWKDQHRRNVQHYRKQLQQQRPKDSASASQNTNVPLSDDDVWARLDQLEAQELRNREMFSSDSEEESYDLPKSSTDQQMGDRHSTVSKTEAGGHASADTPRKGVKWKDEKSDTSEEESSEGESEESDEDENGGRPSTITFTHSKADSCSVPGQVSVTEDGIPRIQSPSDIYKYFAPAPKSILKDSKARPRHDAIKSPSPESVNLASEVASQMGPQAFKDAIVERTATELQQNIVMEKQTVQDAPKRVSLFKAQRLKEQTGSDVTGQDIMSHGAVVMPTQEVADSEPKRISKFKAGRLKQQANH